MHRYSELILLEHIFNKEVVRFPGFTWLRPWEIHIIYQQFAYK